MEDQRGEINSSLGGRSRAATQTFVRSIDTTSGIRRVYSFSGYSRMFVIDRERNNVNRDQMITSHELGHSLGYRGHSATNHAVMHQTTHDHHRLIECETQHMRQIYDAFR